MDLNVPNKTMILFVGIQASGKTSFYQKNFPELVHVSLDELHTRNKENRLIDDCLKKGVSFVVDNTNPTAEDRAKYIEKAKTSGFAVYGFYFQSSISACIERNSKREGKYRVPRNAIAHTHKVLEMPVYAEGFDRLFYVHLDVQGPVVEDWTETEQENEI